MVIAPVLKKVWSPPILWTIGKDDNPELIVNPETSIDIGEVDLEIFAPVKIPTENFPIGSVEYPTVDGIVVASVALLCQDERVFKAMSMAGTPCPYNGKIGKEATTAWQNNPNKRPDKDDALEEFIAKCTYDRNPNRDKINKDVVGAVKIIYTTKTKTKRQCRKEFYAQ